jgi:hypothetical protein
MPARKFLLLGLLLCLIFLGGSFAPSAPPEPKKSPPWEVAKAKMEAARKTSQALAQEFLEGKATVEQLHQWSQRWLNAQRDITTKKTEQVTAYEAHVERMQQLEKAAQSRFESKRGQESDIHAAEYYRLEAQLTLSKFKSSSSK